MLALALTRIPPQPLEPLAPATKRETLEGASARIPRHSCVVLTASVGMGHVRAAQALSQRLGGQGEAAPIIDAVQCMGPLAAKIYRDAFLGLTTKAPSVVAKLYELSDTLGNLSPIARKIDSALTRRLERILLTNTPDTIVSTHFLTGRVASNLKEQGRLRSTLIQVVTDFDAHALWYSPAVDHYCVAAWPAAERLKSFGVHASKISTTGIPLRSCFEGLPSRAEARHQLGLSDEEVVVLLTLGGEGSAAYSSFVRGLLTAEIKFKTIVVCGRNEAARTEVTDLLAHTDSLTRERFQVVGFTEEMHLLMAASDILIGKPGGITSSEALVAGLPMILVNPIPGQEERNADYLLERGVATRCRHPELLGASVDRLLTIPGELSKRARVAREHGAAAASTTIAHISTEFFLRTRALREHPRYLRIEHALARLTSPRVAPGVAVFDLDHTILDGDIGESTFALLAAKGSLQPAPIDTEALHGRLGSGNIYRPAQSDNLYHVYVDLLRNMKGGECSDLGALYAWMSQAMAGLTLHEIQTATEQAWEANGITLHDSAVSLIQAILERQHRVAVISASNQASVTWVIREKLNHELARRGCVQRIDVRDIWGVNNMLTSGASVRDALLRSISDPSHLTTSLQTPVPTFTGKALTIEHAEYGTPVLVAGDSPNDFAMAARAPIIAWRPHGQSLTNSERFLELMACHPTKRFTLL